MKINESKIIKWGTAIIKIVGIACIESHPIVSLIAMASNSIISYHSKKSELPENLKKTSTGLATHYGTIVTLFLALIGIVFNIPLFISTGLIYSWAIPTLASFFADVEKDLDEEKKNEIEQIKKEIREEAKEEIAKIEAEHEEEITKINAEHAEEMAKIEANIPGNSYEKRVEKLQGDVARKKIEETGDREQIL